MNLRLGKGSYFCPWRYWIKPIGVLREFNVIQVCIYGSVKGIEFHTGLYTEVLRELNVMLVCI